MCGEVLCVKSPSRECCIKRRGWWSLRLRYLLFLPGHIRVQESHSIETSAGVGCRMVRRRRMGYHVVHVNRYIQSLAPSMVCGMNIFREPVSRLGRIAHKRRNLVYRISARTCGSRSMSSCAMTTSSFDQRLNHRSTGFRPILFG